MTSIPKSKDTDWLNGSRNKVHQCVIWKKYILVLVIGTAFEETGCNQSLQSKTKPVCLLLKHMPENGGVCSVQQLGVGIIQKTKTTAKRGAIQSQKLQFIVHYGENCKDSRRKIDLNTVPCVFHFNMFLSMLSIFAFPEYCVNLFHELIENIHM